MMLAAEGADGVAAKDIERMRRMTSATFGGGACGGRAGVGLRGLACMAMVVACVVGTLARAQDVMSEDLRRLVASAKLGPSVKVGISVLDAETGRVLGELRADTPLIPASNMKLLTSGAALLVLGPDFQFRTELVQHRDRLVVKGSGDPALADPVVLAAMEPRLSVDDVLGAMVKGVQKAGITSASELVIDDRVFDRQWFHPSWPVEQANRGYAAQVGGVNFHANLLLVYPRPGPQGVGTAPTLALQPEAPWLRITNRAKTVVDGKSAVWITREAGTNTFTVQGEVRSPLTVGVEVTVHDPATFFGEVLSDRLASAGVRVGSGRSGNMPGGVRLATEQETFEGTGRILAVISTPLEEVLLRCNSDSENMYAESMLKRIGHDVTRESGSWANGRTVLRQVLSEKLGPEAAASTTISDGSGLSRENLVTPATFTRWLTLLARNDTTRDAYIASMAVPGQGTLRRRFQSTKLQNSLHAKSGFINGVRCLSGYVVNKETGRSVAFSVMVNNIEGGNSNQAALDLHEEVVQLADRWLSRRVNADTPKVGG
jgi:D-alanyl-D-alanine carboxypeptidase/D-alanyl-D-alanine-endopeptidase (penicillin-binding protein 4)